MQKIKSIKSRGDKILFHLSTNEVKVYDISELNKALNQIINNEISTLEIELIEVTQQWQSAVKNLANTLDENITLKRKLKELEEKK